VVIADPSVITDVSLVLDAAKTKTVVNTSQWMSTLAEAWGLTKKLAHVKNLSQLALGCPPSFKPFVSEWLEKLKAPGDLQTAFAALFKDLKLSAIAIDAFVEIEQLLKSIANLKPDGESKKPNDGNLLAKEFPSEKQFYTHSTSLLTLGHRYPCFMVLSFMLFSQQIRICLQRDGSSRLQVLGLKVSCC